jgi:hypothetical protein
VHVSEPVGARDVTGQVMADRPLIGSVTVTGFRVTLPVFVTTYEYVTGTPGAEKELTLADFTRRSEGDCPTVRVTDEEAVTADPLGGVPLTVPVFLRLPASTSAWVVV